MSYEKAGLKDVVWLGKYEKVLVEAHYVPWDAVYMFHCQSPIHEDSDMMAAFNITKVLPELGYNKKLFKFDDPMAEQWRAKPFVMADFRNGTGPFSGSEVQKLVRRLVTANPYGEAYDLGVP